MNASSSHPAEVLTGRADDLELAERMLRQGVRLLTITGAGGVGKTRLAVATARKLPSMSGAPAVFVDLAPLREPDLVLPTAARALGLAEAGSRPLAQTLRRALVRHPPLLVLDNFEHLLPAAVLVADLLRDCPELRVLVTSRAPLQLPGEHELPLAPLPVPDLHAPVTPAGLARCPAVELFVQRCQQVHPDFALTTSNARTVAEICVRLDGLPLGLELAAIWVKVLEPQELLARLRDRFALLVQPGRPGARRHRRLASTVAWSYDLLEPPAQLLLRRLSVFAGSWSLSAAEGVCSDGDLGEPEVLPLLQVLVGHSLVQTERRDGHCRYRLLETIREFASAASREAGEDGAVQQRYRTWFLQLAAGRVLDFLGPDEGAWLDRLDEEHDDLRAALAHVDPQEADAGLLAAAGLSFFWDSRGYVQEGRACLLRLLEAGGTRALPGARAAGLEALGRLALARDDHDEATWALQASVELFRALRLPGRAAWALASLSISAFRQADRDQAALLAAQACALAEGSGDAAAVARSQAALALSAWGGDDTPAAQLLLEESLALGRRLGSHWAVARMAHFIGWFAYLDGDTDRGVVFERESVTELRGLRDRRMLADCLDTLACLSEASGDLAGTATYLALSERLRDEIGCPRPGYLRQHCARAWVVAQSGLAPLEQAEARRVGAGWDVHRIATHVLTPAARTSVPDLLTGRETEIAGLVARGRTNAAIAAELTLSVRTVERHLENVRTKLGVRSRAEVATWVAARARDG